MEVVQKEESRQENRMRLEFASLSCNESFARVVVGAFVARMDPTVEEMEDVKTAVSEAVTNAIIHGYKNAVGTVVIEAAAHGRQLTVCVADMGIGIEDIEKAMEPLYSGTEGEGRSGMGFSFMEAFMDTLEVESAPGKGTRVTMTKIFGRRIYE